MRIGIVASGPSATMHDAKKLRDCCDLIIAVNDSWHLCRGADGYFADVIYGTDMKWWDYAIADITRDFDGDLYTQRIQWTKEPESLGINCLESERKPGLCEEKGKIHTGQNSGFAAINLALHLMDDDEEREIILLGFDMQANGNQRHHDKVNRPAYLNLDSPYASFCKEFARIDAEKHNLTILNASRRTALTCFPRINLDDL